jgi:hypothetical protein
VRLVSVYFPEHDGRSVGVYGRMVRALERSAAVNSPHTPLDVVRITPDWSRLGGRWHRGHDPQRESLLANTAKLEAWGRAVESAADGELIGLLDADLLVTGELAEVELLRFDLAYTERPAGARYPLNGGVVFLRVSDGTRSFMRRWVAHNDRLLVDGAEHRPLRDRYGGINQAALGSLLETAGLDVLALPCAVWNCEDSCWSSFDPDRTKIVHIKSQLRQACFGQRALDPYNRPLVELWRRFAS